MPNWLQNVITYLQALNTPHARKRGIDTKLIYERITETDREILVRAIHPDGSETQTIVKVFPPGFKSLQ